MYRKNIVNYDFPFRKKIIYTILKKKSRPSVSIEIIIKLVRHINAIHTYIHKTHTELGKLCQMSIFIITSLFMVSADV